MKVCINGQGHMTKMATMAINSNIHVTSLKEDYQGDFAFISGRFLKNV